MVGRPAGQRGGTSRHVGGGVVRSSSRQLNDLAPALVLLPADTCTPAVYTVGRGRDMAAGMGVARGSATGLVTRHHME